MLAVAEKLLKLDVAKVARLRKELGLSMQTAADTAGFKGGRQTWYHIESGDRADVSISTLGRLARALQCDPADLLK